MKTYYAVEENRISQREVWRDVIRNFVNGVQEVMEVSFKNEKDRQAFYAMCREAKNNNDQITYGKLGAYRAYVVKA